MNINSFPKLLLFVLLACAGVMDFAQAQATRALYNAEGDYPQVTGLGDIAQWKFDSAQPEKDLSGNGHDLTLRGKDTRFEKGALVVEEKQEPGDKRVGALTAKKTGLSPKGAFSLEVWFALDEAFLDKTSGYLLDKKYILGTSDRPTGNRDYFLKLRREGKAYRFEVQLGFGADSETVRSNARTLEVGQKYHIVFSYDGKGISEFYLDGENIGASDLEGRGPLTAGSYALSIGDRYGSIGERLLGRIFRVRISNHALSFISGKVLLELESVRTAFARMEKGAALKVRVHNDSLQAIENASLQVEIPGVPNASHGLPHLGVGESTLVNLPIDTSLRTDQYVGSLIVRGANSRDLSEKTLIALTIVPRSLTYMPVVLWGSGELEDLKDIGFTHQIVYPANDGHVWRNGAEAGSTSVASVASLKEKLDEMYAMGLRGVGTLRPGRYVGESAQLTEYRRVDRNGELYARKNVDGQFPRVQEFARELGEAVANSFSDTPGLDGALIHTEVRDGTQISFTDVSRKAYRDFSGEEIPSEVTAPRGYNYKNISDFPKNRVVSDDDRYLKFYRWFWKEGDAWPKLNSQVHDGLKTAGRDRFWTFFDPAVRAPSIWGSGGNVDYLSQWTYTYPDPLKIGLAGDELFAMAEGRPGQGVMNMTQIIWYRSQTTNDPKPGEAHEWEKPEAKFISIAPDHLSEALWIKLTRPVQGIMYHGWGSLTGAKHGSYKLTNPETRERLTELTREVVKPLGPTLLQVPDRKTDVAFLESFASQMFANRGTYGWGTGWGLDAYLIANYAGLQPDIVYDETITERGLGQYKVLFLMHCDVLTESVVQKIQEFQREGGIIVADEFLTPAIQPDIFLPSIRRGAPDVTKKQHQQKAAELLEQLAGYYERSLVSSNPEVLVRSRPYKNAEYVFTINDHRTYGDYVGRYKKVMEKGLPSQSRISLNRSSGFVYDLMNSRQVQADRQDGKLQFSVDLKGGEGNLFLVTDQQADSLQITAAQAVKRGESTSVTIQLNDKNGKALSAVVPLEVTIRDAENRIAEGSGYYGAADGKLTMNLDIASNDATGKWQIEVREGLTGAKAVHPLQVS